ncbi:Acy1 [Symbiodinium natans]|uniref:Acy1 protein n=1 Tax=Symbiodinium natans TaxID=878477 RepID=A0A812I6U0_9DINO|nr:Acy1 [Symbiodinium natans]
MLRCGVSNDNGKTFCLNVIPTEAEAGFDVRITPDLKPKDFQNLLDQWCKEADGITWQIAPWTRALHEHHITAPDDSNPWWVAFRDVMSTMSFDVEPEVFPAATDSRFLRELGIPALGFSPMRRCPILLHEHDEYIPVDVFMSGIDVYVGLIEALASKEKLQGEDEASVARLTSLDFARDFSHTACLQQHATRARRARRARSAQRPQRAERVEGAEDMSANFGLQTFMLVVLRSFAAVCRLCSPSGDGLRESVRSMEETPFLIYAFDGWILRSLQGGVRVLSAVTWFSHIPVSPTEEHMQSICSWCSTDTVSIDFEDAGKVRCLDMPELRTVVARATRRVLKAGLALLTPLRLAVLLGSLGTDMSFETSLDVYSNGLRQVGWRVLTEVNAVFVTVVFFLHREWACATVSLVLNATSWTLCALDVLLAQDPTSPLEEAQRSLARGLATPAWRGLWDYEQQIQAPGLGLLVPYGMTLIQDLDAAAAISGLFAALAAATSLASARVDFNCDWPNQRGQASVVYTLQPCTTYWLYTSYLIGSMAEFTAFAVVSCVLHPLVACLGYALAIEVNTRCSANGFFMESLLAPHVMFFGLQTRVLGTPARRDLAGPGWPAALCMLLRLALPLACCFVPLAHDQEPWQRLGRPIGRAVLEEFEKPTAAAVAAAKACVIHRACSRPAQGIIFDKVCS